MGVLFPLFSPLFFSDVPGSLKEMRIPAGRNPSSFLDLLYSDVVTTLIAGVGNVGACDLACSTAGHMEPAVNRHTPGLSVGEIRNLLLSPAFFLGGTFWRSPATGWPISRWPLGKQDCAEAATSRACLQFDPITESGKIETRISSCLAQ